jgi:hypothetical protein
MHHVHQPGVPIVSDPVGEVVLWLAVPRYFYIVLHCSVLNFIDKRTRTTYVAAPG